MSWLILPAELGRDPAKDADPGRRTEDWDREGGAHRLGHGHAGRVLPPLPDRSAASGDQLVDACRGVKEALLALGEQGGSFPRKVEPIDLPVFQDEVRRRGDPVESLALVLAYNGSTPRPGLDAAVGRSIVDVLLNAGILEAAGDNTLRSPFRTTLFDTVLVIGDKPVEHTDAVMGAGPTTGELARVIPEDASGLSVLDVGTGAGTLGLLAAARGSAAVVATDVNARACAMARLNAHLNGLAIDVRQGSLFDPVVAERFDLVMGQPPFLCLPETVPASTYLHGGEYGDELAMRMLAGVGRVLEPGGLGAFRFDSPVRASPLVDRVRGVTDPVCGVAVFESPGPSPADTAIAYASAAHPDLGTSFAARALDYYRHLRDRGIEEITSALVLARRQPGAIHAFSVQTLHEVPGRAALDRFLAGVDLTADGLQGELLRTRIGPVPGAELVAAHPLTRPDASRWSLRLPDEWISGGASLSSAGVVLFQMVAPGPVLSDVIEAFGRTVGADMQQATAGVLQFVVDGLRHGALIALGPLVRDAGGRAP